MNKTTSTLGWISITLLAGALSLPGQASADWDGHDRGRHHHHKHHDHWRHHNHDRYWDYDRRVVVREPVYVEPRRPVAAPFWGLPGNGVTVILRNDW